MTRSTLETVSALPATTAPDRSEAPSLNVVGTTVPTAWRRGLYGGIIFLSAFLLFLVQPLVSKSILPWFGGAPGVWTVAMLVFQLLLCGGYLYAHLLARVRSTTVQALIHIALLLTAALTLPILPHVSWKPLGTEDPTWRIAATLLASVGLPFAVLSTTGPLIQSWFGRTEQGTIPYRLYSLSNLGSLLALVAYPFVIEPLWSLRVQSNVWSGLFVLFAVLCSLAALVVARHPQVTTTDAGVTDSKPNTTPLAPIRPAQLAVWFVLGMIPSVMLIATTNQLCLDIAPVPFLWVLPLALYLISFVLCFEGDRWLRPTLYAAGFVLFSGMIVLGAGSTQLPYQLTAYLGTLFCVAMLCHGEFARRKPDPRHLTLYYLVLSFAGAAGGLFVGILAPRIFNRFYELPLCLLAVAGLALLHFAKEFRRPQLFRKLVAAAASLGAVAMVWGLGSRFFREAQDVLAARRDFFGVLSVSEMLPEFPLSTARTMAHGQISHGMQHVHPSQRPLPTGYFGPESGIGRVLATADQDSARRIGVVGLGVGTLATYCGPRDTLRFYELSRNVEDLAREYFTYLVDCRGKVDVVLGDARLVLEREVREDAPPLDVLALDAFSGDSIPSHLLTHEAFAAYLERLAPDGILAVHFTNRHLDLEPVLADLARHSGLTALVVENSPRRPEEAASIWTVMARDPKTLARPSLEGARPIDASKPLAWTDDYSSLFAVMKPFHWEGLIPQSTSELSPARAYAAMREEKWDIAARELERLIESAPANPAYCVNLGDVRRLQGHDAQAVTWYRRAIAINDRNARVHHTLGTLLAPTDPNTAAKHLLTSVTQDPRQPEPHVDLGNLLLRHGKAKEAIRAYHSALALQPDHAAASANLKLAEQALLRSPTRGG